MTTPTFDYTAKKRTDGDQGVSRPCGGVPPLRAGPVRQDTLSTKSLVMISRLSMSFTGFGQVGPRFSKSDGANGKKMHSRRDRPTIAVRSLAAVGAENGVSLSGTSPLSMLQRNTLCQTKMSWFTNGFGAFVVLFCPGRQARFYVLPASTHGRKVEQGSHSCGPQPTLITVLCMGSNCSRNPAQHRPGWGAVGGLFGQYSHVAHCRW